MECETKVNNKFNGWIGIIFGTIGILIIFRAYLFAPGWNWLFADDFDSRLLTWIFEWGYHVIFQEKTPALFFESNSFYPHPHPLAFSDSLLSAQLFYAPFRMLGVPTIPAVYLALGSLVLLSTIITDRGLCRLNFSPLERGIIIWISHFGLSMTSYMGHYQLFGFQFAPPLFIYTFLFLKNFTVRDSITVIFLFSVGILFSVYLAPMFVAVSCFASIPLIPEVFKRLKNSNSQRRALFISMILISSAMIIIYLVHFRVYFSMKSLLPEQSLEETSQYAGRIKSFIRDYSLNSFWHSPSGYSKNGDWERSYAPGWILLFSTGLYLIILLITGFKRFKSNEHLRSKLDFSFENYLIVVFLASLVLSWGPYLWTDPSRPLPYYYLTDIFPGLSSLRAPGRFGMFFGLPLAIFLTSTLKHLNLSSRNHGFLKFIILVLVIIETIPKFSIFPFPHGDDRIYQEVSNVIEPRTPMIELPVAGPGHFETLRLVMTQLNGSTYHWGRHVIGYGSRYTAEYTDLIVLDQQIQQQGSGPQEIFKFCERLKIKQILIRRNLIESARYEELIQLLKSDKRFNLRLLSKHFATFQVNL